MDKLAYFHFRVSCTRLTRRPRPSGPEGSPVDPATKTFLLKTKGTKSQQVELRGDGGEKGQCREFFVFTKIESEGFSLSQKVKVIPV